MRKLIVFNQISLDGYFCDENGDMSWAHKQDPEWLEFVANNARGGGGPMLFGRVTYEMMSSFWPTKAAKAAMPVVADSMNNHPKVVFSRTLDKADWSNTKLVKGGLTEEVRKLKSQSGQDLLVMGSGTIVSQLAAEDLVDELRLIMNPITLGKGRTLFETLEEPLLWKLKETRAFGNGNVQLVYAPAR